MRKWTSETAKSVCEATGKVDPISGARQLAFELIELCDLTYPARNLDMVASFQGAKILEDNIKDAGCLITYNGPDYDYIIKVRKSDSQSRKNFSICHEIGHTLMPNFNTFQFPHHDGQTMRWSAKDEEEFLCDVAAAEILMPRKEFVPRLRGCGLNIESIQELAEEFGASLEATAVNVVEARIDDIAVIVWEQGWNKHQAKLNNTKSLFDEDEVPALKPSYRIKFANSCGEMKNFYFPQNISLDEDSIIFKASSSPLPIRGMAHLKLGGNRVEQFYTQSQSFQIRRGGEYERKIFTIVHFSPPNDF